MTRLTVLSAVFTLCITAAAAQTQPGVQGSASATSSTAVRADQTGVQAAGNSSVAASAQAGRDSASLAGGTTMQAALTHPLDCKKSKAGDPVTAKTTTAATAEGQLVIPKGSKLVGHVTEARQHEKARKDRQAQDSALGIAWDKVVLKNGQEIPLRASIQALASAQVLSSSAASDADIPAGGGAMASGSARGALGGVGGVGSTVNGAVGGVGNAAGGALNSTTRAVGSTANVAGSATATATGSVGGLNAEGQFVANSRGVFGLHGLSLSSAASSSAEGSLITSSSENVHLDSGSRMLLVAQGQQQANVH